MSLGRGLSSIQQLGKSPGFLLDPLTTKEEDGGGPQSLWLGVPQYVRMSKGKSHTLSLQALLQQKV